jgi:hypothetical protein
MRKCGCCLLQALVVIGSKYPVLRTVDARAYKHSRTVFFDTFGFWLGLMAHLDL